MKKILSLVAGLMLFASLSFADEAPIMSPVVSPTTGSGMYLGLGAGLDFPSYNWWPGTPTGLGGKLFAGYSFDRSMAVQLDLDGGIYSYSNGNSTVDLYVLPEFKYTFDNPGFQPYLLLGAGLNLSYDSIGGISTSSSYFAGVAGAGIQFDVATNTSLFIEGKFHMVFVSELGSGDVANDFPITAGLKFNI